MVIATVALVGNCLLTSPPRFSAAHEADRSLLKPVVSALALGGAYPTARLVEIRNLFFYVGAAALALIAGIRLLSSDRRPRLSGDDLLDFRRRARSPYFWWLLLLLASVLSSLFSHAPDMCKGQTIIRFLHLAWWWPLAALLAARHVRSLTALLLTVLSVTAALGVWYHVVRNSAGTALAYPIGNPLWQGACLLPGLFLSVGLFAGCFGKVMSDGEEDAAAPPSDASTAWMKRIGLVAAFGVILAALLLTRSRSAGFGLIAGVFALAAVVSTKILRRVVVLVALILAIWGAVWVQGLRTEGVMGQRAHSVRVRLNHEWPYALTMFFQKPVLGHGDGSYALLAGQYARDEQLEDPRTISFDGWSWFDRAHNEYLQLLSELGLVGMIAFCMAMVLTLYRAVQYCDRARSDRAARSRRWLVMGLVGALVALAFEEIASPAFREPGLPPILLTVWAALWALVRAQQQAPEPAPEARRLGNFGLRMGGVATGIVAVILGYFGIQDWRGARAHFDGDGHMTREQYDESIALADFAEAHRLDPFRKAIARLLTVWARANQFEALLEGSDLPPTDAELAFGQDALARLRRLDAAAPRFLRSALLRASLNEDLAVAYGLRGESDSERDCKRACLEALAAHRQNEKDHRSN